MQYYGMYIHLSRGKAKIISETAQAISKTKKKNEI